MREAHICVHGVGLRGGYSTWHAEASIGRGMRMPLCVCMWYSYVQAVIERGSLVGTAGPVWAVYVCSAGPRCAQHVWHGDASVDGDNVMAMCVCML